MSYEQPLFSVGEYVLDFDASSIATAQYTAVTLGNATQSRGTGLGKASLLRPTAGGLILGILQSNGALNEAVPVMVLGLSKARVAPGVTGGKVGDLLAVDVNGFFVKAATGQFAVAVAHEDYSGGDITTVRLGTFGKA